MSLVSPIQVVVADDSEIYRQSLLSFLRRFAGLTVVATAGDGEEAVRLVAEKNPDLLILDINMPKMDGWEVLGQLRHANAAVQILVLTAHANPDLRLRALREGATAWVTKDNIQLLSDTLNQLLAE